MKNIVFAAPSRYIQGRHIIGDLPDYVAALGTRCLVLSTPSNMKRMASDFKKVTDRTDFYTMIEPFNGECSMNEINRIRDICKENGIDVVAGVGGGKVLDTAKAVSHFCKIPVVIVPTAASSDAPTSALSVIYYDDGSLDKLLFLKTNPNVVLMDLDVIANAPAHLLAVGMGDALATYFESKECFHADGDNCVGGRVTLTAMAIAKQCAETILKDGYKAYCSAQRKVVTTALENVVEANTLMSGIGFESAGVCSAHPINNGIAAIEETHPYMHGEKVAFALLVHLLLAKESDEVFYQVMDLFKKVGLPITLKQLGVEEITEDKLNLIASIANGDSSTHYLPQKIDEEVIKGAVVLADELGTQYLNK